MLVSTDGSSWTAVTAGALLDLRTKKCKDQRDQIFKFPTTQTRYVKIKARVAQAVFKSLGVTFHVALFQVVSKFDFAWAACLQHIDVY